MISSNDSPNYIGNELEIFKNASNWKKYFSKKIAKYVHGDILEVGAGLGINTQYLSNTQNIITSWCLLEPDSKLSSQIEANTAHFTIPKLTIINGTIKSIKDQKFDTIIYIDVLEHIEESEIEIKLIKERLKPNGYAIILVPAYKFLYSNFDKKIGHFRRYDKKLFKREVNSQLTLVELYYLDSIGFFASLMNKLILKKDLPSVKNVNFWDKILIPLSKLCDILFFRLFGKSLIGILKHNQ